MPSIPTIFRAPAEIPAALDCDSYSTSHPAVIQGKSLQAPLTAGCYRAAYDTQPALKSIRRWQRQAKVLRLIVAALTWPFRFAFGCRHPHPTLPYNDHQTCLDCGAARTYAYTPDGIFIGRWRHVTTTTVRPGRDGRSAILNPGADSPLFQRPKNQAVIG
jgi:hypothetical protein